MISPDIKPNPSVPGSYGLPCSQMANISAELTFGFISSSSGKTFDITIPTSEFNLGPFDNDTSLCQALINVWLPGQDLPPLLGASLLKHYYTVWDTGNQSMGFAAICTCCVTLGLVHQADSDFTSCLLGPEGSNFTCTSSTPTQPSWAVPNTVSTASWATIFMSLVLVMGVSYISL
jgi:hypothetical protein